MQVTPIIVVFLYTIVHRGGCEFLYPPDGFFSVEDVSGVTWAHGVNSQEFLTNVFDDPDIRMIEADLIQGKLNISGEISLIDTVIMAHPPAKTSDLSFESFITQVIEYNKGKPLQEMKGVKLDFKDYFSAAWGILNLGGKNRTEHDECGQCGGYQFPIWLNADVVKGPLNSTSEPKTTGVQLLRLHNLNLPSAVLSLGWTTNYPNYTEGVVGSYTREHVDSMIQVFRTFNAIPEATQQIPVTFAVRAAFAENSLGNLMYLLNATSFRSSLTLWGGSNDAKINSTRLADMFKLVGKGRVFIDLPYDWKYSSAHTNYCSLIFIPILTLAFSYVQSA